MSFSPSSRARLTEHDVERFPGDTLFDRIGRAVCAAGVLPRRELYEAWEVARRVRRRFKGGRVIDIAGGHGLLAQMMLLLDRSSPNAIVVDRVLPPSHVAVHTALVGAWPHLAGTVTFIEADLGTVSLEPGDVVVSSHACGALTDAVLERASEVRARVAVLPCCHVVPRNGADAIRGVGTTGLSRVDAAHPRYHHEQEPVVAGGTIACMNRRRLTPSRPNSSPRLRSRQVSHVGLRTLGRSRHSASISASER